MQDSARVVIIGGGIIGCSTAYHLTKMGWEDVVILEKGELTSGSTWHAAGLVGQLRGERNITRMLQYSVSLYEQLEAETGLATGWKKSGCLHLASTKERMYELKKGATTARSFGLSRPTVYQALSAFEQGGLVALEPQKPGPRRAHKLNEEVVNFLEDTRADTPHLGIAELVVAVEEQFGLSVHPRSIERALVRRKKKRR